MSSETVYKDIPVADPDPPSGTGWNLIQRGIKALADKVALLLVKQLTEGTNVTIDDLGDGNFRINSTASGGTPAWGSITGTLGDQTDLQTALDDKANVTGASMTTAVVNGVTLDSVGSGDSFLAADGAYKAIGTSIQGIWESTGLIDVGTGLSINADTTKFDVPAIEGYVVDHTVDPPTVTNVTRAASTGETSPFIGTDTVTYVGCDVNGVLQLKNTPFTDQESREYFVIGTMSTLDNVNWAFAVTRPTIAFGGSAQDQDFMRALGLFRSGQGLCYVGNADLTMNRTAGRMGGLGIGFAAGAFPYDDPNALAHVAEAVVGDGASGDFFYQTSLGGGAAAGGGGTLVDPTTWENPLGSTATVANSKFTNQYVFMYSSGVTGIQYGQTEYSSLDDAKAAVEKEAFVVNQTNKDLGLLVACISIAKSCTDMSDPATCFITNFGKLGGNLDC